MLNPQANLIGTLLKTIACTPNRNACLDAYAEGVLAPTASIREIGAAIGDRTPGDSQVDQLFQLLLQALRTKRIPDDEINARLTEIARMHGLSGIVERHQVAR